MVYEHAKLQNVEFKWVIWGRPYRYQPDIRTAEKLSELETVTFATERIIEFQTTYDFTVENNEKCKL